MVSGQFVILLYILHCNCIMIVLCLGSFVRNLHIGFDPDYELIKNTRPVSTKTPDERIVYLVMAIELEVKSEQFRYCYMSQNRAVVEKKTVQSIPRTKGKLTPRTKGK